ncbi:CHAP domain-containing protein [Microbispora rosea]|uniref:CHAP domain-containing protein n=1 Tax=Microbispora rosea TaxID=58117 RepID=UPI003797254E
MSAAKMLAAARKDIGLVGRPNHITKAYAKAHGSEYLSAPWCDMSVTHWAHESGNTTAVLPEGDRAYTVAHAQDGKDAGRWYPGTAANIRAHAAPGDIVFFDWGGTNTIGAIDHVGVVEVNLGDGRIQTIEGNTGDACKRRVRGPEVIAGIFKPDYEGEDMPSAKEVADAVYDRLTGTVTKDVWAAREGILDVGQKLDPKTAFRQIWAYSKDGYAQSRAIRAELGALNAAVKTLADALAQRDTAIDADALVERIRQEISNVVVHLSTAPADEDDSEPNQG